VLLRRQALQPLQHVRHALLLLPLPPSGHHPAGAGCYTAGTSLNQSRRQQPREHEQQARQHTLQQVAGANDAQEGVHVWWCGGAVVGVDGSGRKEVEREAGRVSVSA
jgi:hypothetical protein